MTLAWIVAMTAWALQTVAWFLARRTANDWRRLYYEAHAMLMARDRR